jgi:glycosyltransferase involved in cell wall biosynthesis
MLPFHSSGIFSIGINLIYLLKFKHKFFHITGDIHYAILFLPANQTVLTIHDLVFLHTYKGIRRLFLKWIFLDLPVKKAKYITTISEKSKEEIIKNTGCNPNKIKVIPNPVDIGIKFIEKEFNTVKPVLLFLGTKDNKNLESSIAALYKLSVHLRIIGELTFKQKEMLNKFSIEYSNAFSISQEDLQNEYQQCDVVFFPSTYEGFGLPVIEGFQAGRPVLTSNISPMKEVSADAAMLINPTSIASIRNGLIKLINEPLLRAEMVKNGFEVVKDYAPSAIALRYEQLWGVLV